MTKYVVISDIHAHTWTLFAKTNPDGVNSRLRIILDEMERAANYGIKQGARHMVIAGDLFHTRGIIDPEVLNPLRETILKILRKGMNIDAIPGNHDLKSRDTSELSSSIQNLDGLSALSLNNGACSFKVRNKVEAIKIDDALIGFVPWQHDKVRVLAGLKELQQHPEHEKMDVFIHAGISGVLPHSAGDELSASELADFGFRHVLAGHYHNHKTFSGGICSIGAIAHHNWGDVGTRAGFLLMDSESPDIHYVPSEAPDFVDLSGMSEAEMKLACVGNYVRFRDTEITRGEAEIMRHGFQSYGALGVSIEVPRVKENPRTTTPTKTTTIEDAVNNFIDGTTFDPQIDVTQIKSIAQEVLATSRMALQNS